MRSFLKKHKWLLIPVFLIVIGMFIYVIYKQNSDSGTNYDLTVPEPTIEPVEITSEIAIEYIIELTSEYDSMQLAYRYNSLDDYTLYEELDDVFYKVGKTYMCGLINKEGVEIVPVKYNNIKCFSIGLFGAESRNENGTYKWELFDKLGNNVTSSDYEMIDENDWWYENIGIEGVLYAVKRDGSRCFIDETGKEIESVIPNEYDVYYDDEVLIPYSKEFLGDFFGVCKDGKWGFMDRNWNIVVPCEYDSVYNFSNGGKAWVCRDGKWGLINNNNEVLIPFKYDDIMSFWYRDAYGFDDSYYNYKLDGVYRAYNNNNIEGFVWANKDGKWGIIDENKDEVTLALEYEFKNYNDVNYHEDFSFYEGLARIGKDGKYGYVDETGKIVIPLEYDFVFGFRDGYAKVVKDDKKGYIDKKGNVIIPLEFDLDYRDEGSTGYPMSITDNKLWLEKNGETYVYDILIEAFIVPDKFDGVSRLWREKLTCVWKNDKYGFIDGERNIIIPLEYDYASDFCEGMAFVQKDGEYYIINEEGERLEFYDCEYDESFDFDEFYFDLDGNILKITKNKKSGAIGKNGDIVIPFEYDYISNFENGLARVEKNGKWGLIDESGNVILSPSEYTRMGTVDENGYCFVEKGNSRLCGLIHKNGDAVDVIVPEKYDWVYYPDEIGLIYVGNYTPRKRGLFDKNGTVVLPLEYDEIHLIDNTNAAIIKKDGKCGVVQFRVTSACFHERIENKQEPELVIINMTKINEAESVEIERNIELGDNPAPSYFGERIVHKYPLKNINQNDEIVIIIENFPNYPFSKQKTYIICDSTAIFDTKNEFYYFESSPGMLPAFYIQIFVNGEAVENDFGDKGLNAICLHLPPPLSEAVKPIFVSEFKDDNNAVTVKHSKSGWAETETYYSLQPTETLTPDISREESKKSDLTAINDARIDEAKSVEIDGNIDLGENPDPYYFGRGIFYQYPLRYIDFDQNDEVVIVIEDYGTPFPNNKTYIIYDSKALFNVKNEFYYFVAPAGMTPAYYMNIYINGVSVKNNYGSKYEGAICFHIPPELSGAIKPVTTSETKDESTVAIVQPSKADYHDTERYYNIQ